ncbi:MAG: monovalent cation/H(+) antiporter subunit G [Deltaproteobacteria bacterium]|nr:monovalent cation/H(+) antiporter subunit G [Deltaproteobacteria bacterium]
MMRLPDIYCRSHALAKSMPLGVNSMLIGLWVHMDLYHSSGFKVFLAILFQVISIPVAGHVMALLAYRKGVPRHNEREIDIY